MSDAFAAWAATHGGEAAAYGALFFTTSLVLFITTHVEVAAAERYRRAGAAAYRRARELRDQVGVDR